MSGGDEPPDDWRRGVRPLARGKQKPPPAPRTRRPRPPAQEPAIAFAVAREGERVEGFAPGVDRGRLRRLRRGEPPAESTLDLHGLDRAAARRALREHVLAAAEAGQRCVLVVHGRGNRSAAGPVLKEQLPGWLTAPPLHRLVLAFTSAAPGDGGAGALYVLLRRRML